MIRFNCDYTEGAHQQILQRLIDTNMEQHPGYSEDEYCRRAAEKIRGLCKAPEAAVHFLVGGTQTNLIVIASALRPHQGVVCADTGHKVLGLPHTNGKIKYLMPSTWSTPYQWQDHCVTGG